MAGQQKKTCCHRVCLNYLPLKSWSDEPDPVALHRAYLRVLGLKEKPGRHPWTMNCLRTILRMLELDNTSRQIALRIHTEPLAEVASPLRGHHLSALLKSLLPTRTVQPRGLRSVSTSQDKACLEVLLQDLAAST